MQDRGAVHHTHLDVGVVVGPVVVDGVAGDDVVTDEFGHLLGRGLAVGTGGAEQLHAVGTGAESLELGQQRRQNGPVRHGTGQVGEDDGHPVA